MSTITTRSGKGSPLTNSEVDTNFTNLNTDKLENITGESIKNLSDVNSSMSPSAGDALVYDASNGWQSGTVSTGAVANTVVVTVANSKFVIDGTSQQALTLSPSVTYRFDQSNNSNANHPLKFSTTDNGTHNSGSEFTTGVTVSGTAGSTDAYVEIKLEQDAPSTLYYYCGNHSGMGGVVSSGGTAVTVQDEGSALSTAAETLNFTGAGVTASGTGTAKTINIPGATVTTNGSLDPVKQTEFTATANQTSFSVAYGVGNISVYLNGSKLAAADYTATNGTSVALAAGATTGDLVVVEEYGIPFASPYTASVYTASAGQTTLSVSYTVAKVAVFVNGVKLLIGANADVVAANGTSLTFNTALSAGDKIEVVEHGALVETTTTFTGLTDTPSSLGSAGQVAQVNNAGNAIEFADASSGTTTFTGLTDTPSSFGSAGQIAQVNSAGNAIEFVDAGAGVTTVANLAQLEALTAAQGDMAFRTDNNFIYIRKSNGWYKIAEVTNNQLQSVTVTMSGGGEADGTTYKLATDGTDTLATGAATDPEGLSVTWSAAPISPATLSGNNIVVSSTNVATLTQGTGSSSNVFTLDPVATSGVHNFSIRFSVTDGINATIDTDEAYVLTFITTIADSRYTVLLAEGQGSGDNSSFTDSTSNYTLSEGRDSTSIDYPVASSFSPYRKGGYSVEYHGAGQHLVTENFPSGVTIGTDNYTVEFWLWRPSSQSTHDWLIMSDQGSAQLRLRVQSSGALEIYMNATSFTTSTTVGANAWHHVCFTRGNSNAITVYLDGTSIHTQTGDNTSLNSTNGWKLGGHNSAQTVTEGLKIHDLRVVKGSVIVPPSGGPTEPLLPVSGTYFMAHTKPYLAYQRQTSSSDATLVEERYNTISGSQDNHPGTSPDTPYDHDENSSADTGGSISFNGDNWVEIGSPISGLSLTGDFTVEFWVYLKDPSNYKYKGLWSFHSSANDVKFDFQGKLEIFGLSQGTLHAFTTRSWHHVAVSRTGSSIYIYINGERHSTGTSQSYNASGYAFLGRKANGADCPFYLADFRYTVGSSLYSAASITPPTEPLSTTANTTTLHVKGNDGAIIDKKAASELVLKPRSGSGQPAGDTTDVVYGGSTIYSNCFSMTGGGQSDVNNGEYIQVPNMTKLEGQEDLTIECWVYPTNISSYQVIFSHGELRLSVGVSGGRNRYTIYLPGKGFNFDYDTDSTYSIPNNAWSFLQLVRDGSSGTKTWKAYLNGSQVWGTTSFGTQSVSTTTTPCIGATPTGGERFKGKIQGLRVSKGLVRPTTVPTSPFKG